MFSQQLRFLLLTCTAFNPEPLCVASCQLNEAAGAGALAAMFVGAIAILLLTCTAFNPEPLCVTSCQLAEAAGAGALAAMLVGASSLACSWRMGITLLAFFGASSRLTHFREELKDVDESHRSGGQRDWQQVCL